MIKEIIELEFDFMGKVQHSEGRASCQDNYEMFSKYRNAQFSVYNNEVLESYLNDLLQYKEIGYNPIMLKYARMMESSDYDEYKQIEEFLPVIDEQSLELINQVVAIEVVMKEEFAKMYPTINSQTRISYTDDDQVGDVSFETYLRAELSTYSPKTLYLYAKMLHEMMIKKENMVINIQEKTVLLFGFNSLLDAEEKLKNKE